MRKIVINACFGGFSLSHEAVMRYAEIKGIKLYVDGDNFLKHYYKVEPDKYNKCSDKWYKEDGNYKRINDKDWYFTCRDIERDDPALIQVVKELGDKANGSCAKLEIKEIPDDVKWEIDEYDGNETIDEVHRSW